ncbi:uncharacterized protein Tco025E_02589, partial [Trypanosoma conorhini]
RSRLMETLQEWQYLQTLHAWRRPALLVPGGLAGMALLPFPTCQSLALPPCYSHRIPRHGRQTPTAVQRARRSCCVQRGLLPPHRSHSFSIFPSASLVPPAAVAQ